jgi:hypothetical protein
MSSEIVNAAQITALTGMISVIASMLPLEKREELLNILHHLSEINHTNKSIPPELQQLLNTEIQNSYRRLIQSTVTCFAAQEVKINTH